MITIVNDELLIFWGWLGWKVLVIGEEVILVLVVLLVNGDIFIGKFYITYKMSLLQQKKTHIKFNICFTNVNPLNYLVLISLKIIIKYYFQGCCNILYTRVTHMETKSIVLELVPASWSTWTKLQLTKIRVLFIWMWNSKVYKEQTKHKTYV